jgi:hypothetical protein
MIQSTTHDIRRRLGVWSCAAGAVLVIGCSGDVDPTVEVTHLDRRASPPSYDAFESMSRRISADGELYYVVEGDIPMRTEDELFDYHRKLTTAAEKGVLHLHGGADDVWQNADPLNLRYCVDTDPATGFDAAPVGASSATIIAAMEAATNAWERVVNVQFQYDPGNNLNCGRTDPIPNSTYIKVSRDNSLSGACAFGPRSHAAWTCAGLDGNTVGVGPNVTLPPGSSWTYIMMHELGHVLGLHHEFFHTNGGGCGAPDTRNVTAAVDSPSVMGYAPAWEPGCSQTDPIMSALSEGDGWTVRQFYGMPAAWYVPTVFDI